MTADSAAKHAADSKSLAQRECAKADTERALIDAESEKTSTVKEPMATVEYIGFTVSVIGSSSTSKIIKIDVMVALLKEEQEV